MVKPLVSYGMLVHQQIKLRGNTTFPALPKTWLNHILSATLPSIKEYTIEKCKNHIYQLVTSMVEEAYTNDDESDDDDSDVDDGDSVDSDCTPYDVQCRKLAGIATTSNKDIFSGYVLKISDVDTEIFINAVISHNNTWDLGMQLEVYKQNNPGMSKQTNKRFTYFNACQCDNCHQKWHNSNEVDI